MADGPRSTGLPELPWARERGLPTEVARVAAAGAGGGSRAADGSTTIDYTYGQDPGGESVAIRPGTRVRHAQFGPGVVRWVEGAGESTKVTVQFERAGTRKLLLRFAPLEVVA